MNTQPTVITFHNQSCTMAFGRPSKHLNCPRCNELRLGSPARKGWGSDKLKREAEFRQSLKDHNCLKAGCMPVCTFGDW